MHHSISTAFIRCRKGLNGIARLFAFTLIFVLSLPAVADATTKSTGFIAVSDAPLTWADAKAWCEQQGGRLPLIGENESLRRNDATRQETPVDGFGSVGAPWPPGLPNVSYWSGTENIDLPVHSWVVSVDSGSVFVLIARQSILVSAVCVP